MAHRAATAAAGCASAVHAAAEVPAGTIQVATCLQALSRALGCAEAPAATPTAQQHLRLQAAADPLPRQVLNDAPSCLITAPHGDCSSWAEHQQLHQRWYVQPCPPLVCLASHHELLQAQRGGNLPHCGTCQPAAPTASASSAVTSCCSHSVSSDSTTNSTNSAKTSSHHASASSAPVTWLQSPGQASRRYSSAAPASINDDGPEPGPPGSRGEAGSSQEEPVDPVQLVRQAAQERRAALTPAAILKALDAHIIGQVGCRAATCAS